jgi:hypothetical protein
MRIIIGPAGPEVQMSIRFLWLVSLSICLTLMPACGGDDDDDSGDSGSSIDSGNGDEVDAGGDGVDASVQPGFQNLLTTTWTLPPPTSTTPDQYFCASYTLKEDVILDAFHSISPNGTHHTVLSVGPPTGPDNPGRPCGAGSNHDALLYASGVGTDDFVFPEGVGVRVEAGQQLQLNVHTFNATDSELTGTSGVAARAVESVEQEAEFLFVGPVGFSIPGDGEEHDFTGECGVNQDQTVLNWWPHMHQYGTHMTIEVNGEVVHDERFRFNDQVNYPTNRQIQAGDTIRVTCRYVNDTGEAVGWGDSSNAEMCFAGSYRYPKGGDSGFCFAPPN